MSSVFICLPAVHPYPFPVRDVFSYYVVLRGIHPGIYSSCALASQQLVESHDYWERAVGWHAAWHVWMCHCHHRHDHSQNSEVNVLEEILDEPLSVPISPTSSREDTASLNCCSAGTPPPSPETQEMLRASFVADLTDALVVLQMHLGDSEDAVDGENLLDSNNLLDGDNLLDENVLADAALMPTRRPCVVIRSIHHTVNSLDFVRVETWQRGHRWRR
ncbi:hypothetical protein GGX14DRAFT_393192 [Mycena pura]|uniref:Uncharacterized protein n=1 Tax=Mycena pura TaxID=153505 RepID=A0AAD6YIQ1_9AGAR|nr:hypothetical protein GGX14DRAFT_393192 [Mycena pura]